MNERLASLQEKLRNAKALLSSEGYRDILLPELGRLASFHKEACRDRKLTADKRAEHVEASHMADELLAYLTAYIRDKESAIAHEQSKK